LNLKIQEKGIEAIQNFKIKCKDVIINKINELDIADLSNPVNNHFKYLGEFSILIHSQNYNKKDVELIIKAKEDYISFFRNLKLNIDAILPYDLIRDLKDDLLIDFKPFLTEEDKLQISKFKSFDEFLEFCKPQLKGFKLNVEIQESFDKINNTLYTTNEENAIDLLISNVEKFKSNNENNIKEYFRDNNIQMFFNNTEKITDSKLLKELNLYFQFSDLLLNARNKLETIPLLKEIGNRRNIKALPPQQNEKPKPELNEALISFSSTEIIESLHNELKGYFQGKETELKRALHGKQLQEFLLFPHNQNKFVEVFKRLKYNGFLLSTPKEINDWICSTFTYQYNKGNKKEVREFNTSTVHDILTKDKGEPTKKERICIVDWLPYKSHLTRQREVEKENI